MSNQKINETIALPQFSYDLGGFVSRLRSRLFPTQSKAARHFGLKSHGTISRYESETLRPPLGYVANLVRLYVDKLEQEGQPSGTGRAHFVREVNRVVRQHYSWDEAPFHNWEALCAVADEFMASRQATVSDGEDGGDSTEILKVGLEGDTPPRSLQTFLSEFIGVQTLAFLFADTEKQRNLRNRQALLKLVNDFWIGGVLENSLYNSVLIELGMQERQEAVEQSWDLLLKTTRRQDMFLPPGTKIMDVYHQMGQSLLILGEPGAGKTTMLLTLARQLIEEAEQNPLLPIPVMFNLSSWTDADQPLADWLVEELHAKYKIPRRISRPWVENDALLPLMDGLDEVAAEGREDCVRAINHFHQEYLVPLVVCSRVADYELLATRLKLRGAVLLQPLTPKQIETYLNQLRPKLSNIRQMLNEDAWLRELAQTPLMLNIITLAYWQTSPQPTQQLDTPKVRQKHLFGAYVNRMLERRSDSHKPYSNSQTIRWLSWLAGQMSRHSQSIYLFEQMQPSWLGGGAWIWLYLFLSRMGSMVPGGLLIGLVAGVSGVSLFGLENTPLAQSGFWLLFGLLLGVVNGLILVGVDAVRLELADSRRMKLPSWLKALMIGAIFGVVDGLIFWQFGGKTLGLIGGVTMGLTYGLAIEMRGSQRAIFDEIQTVETMSWSWQEAIKGAAMGISLGLLVGTVGAWIVGLDPELRQSWSTGPFMRLLGRDNFVVMGSLFGACLLGLIGAIFGGMRSQIVETKVTPNQGIWLSMKYALASWLGVGLIIGAGGGVLFGLFSGLQYSLGAGLALFICFGSLAALWYGGLDLIQHHALRFLLWRQGNTPRRYIQFLDYATERIFLRKVGGGYVFIHRTLLEYFASLGKDGSEN